MALGVAAAVSSWAVLAVVVVAAPWATVILLPLAVSLRRGRSRAYAIAAAAAGTLILAGLAGALVAHPQIPALISGLVILVCYGALVAVPLLRT